MKPVMGYALLALLAEHAPCQDRVVTVDAPSIREPWSGRGRYRQVGQQGHFDFWRAIDDGLTWLASRQEEDGSWPRRRSDQTTTDRLVSASEKSPESRFGVTGLAVIAFLADARADWRTGEGEYGQPLRRGMLWLIAHVDDATWMRQCEDRALGVLALVDACATSPDEILRRAATHGTTALADGLAQLPGPLDDQEWRGACLSVFALSVANLVDLENEVDLVAAMKALYEGRPDRSSSTPILYMASLFLARTGLETRESSNMFRREDVVAVPARDPMDRAALFDLWQHMACTSLPGVAYHGPGGYKRVFQIVQARDSSTRAWESTRVSAERLSSTALIMLRPLYKLGRRASANRGEQR